MIGAAILLALAGGVYWSERKSVEETGAPAKDAPPKLVTLKDDDVQQVQIQRKGEPATVIHRGKATAWEMIAPKPLRVDSDSMSSLVSAFTGLTWDRLVEDKPVDLNSFGLRDPSAQVTVVGKDGKKQTLLIGDETPTGGNYFAKLADDTRVFSIFSGTKNSLDKTWTDLRDKRLLTFDENKLTRVELGAKGQTVEFGKNAQNEWQMVKPRPLRADNLQVEELVRKLKDARMDTAASDQDSQAAPGKFYAGTRIAAVNVTDASGTQTLEVRKSGEDYFARSTAVEGIHKVGTDLGEALNKGIDDFRNKKLFDFGFTDPSKLEIRDIGGGKTYHLVKGGEKWWASGKEMDATSVQSLIDKLRDLTSIKFVDAGFTEPLLEATVTSNDGKRVEKVQIAKSGDSYLAKRDNEPSIYEVDGKRVDEIQRAAADVKPPPPPPAKK
jgi:hypothetical protein